MRINFYGGPGTGKSTLAAEVFTRLRQQGHTCGLVTEWIKQWAYEQREPRGFDLIYAFACQLHSEEETLRHTKVIISDSPVYLQCMYADFNSPAVARDLWSLAHTYEARYPSVNFYVERRGTYEQHGRYESESDARKMDERIKAQLGFWCVPYTVVTRDGIDTVLDVLAKTYLS